MKTVSIGAALCGLLLSSSLGFAQVAPPPGGGPGGGGGGGGIIADTADHGGHRWSIRTGTAVSLAASVAGNVLLYEGEARPSDYWLWNIGSAIGGPVGGGAALALFQERAGLFTKLFRPGGFRCQAGDRVDGCAEWVRTHPSRVRTARVPSVKRLVHRRTFHAAWHRASHRTAP